MALKWSALARLAHSKRGWSEEVLRAELAKMNVSSATATNWSGGKSGDGRPIPVARHMDLAQMLGISVEELNGRKPPTGVRETTLVYDNPDDAAHLLAAEIAKLNPEMRSLLSTIIDVLVAKQVNAARESKKAPKSKRNDRRPDA